MKYLQAGDMPSFWRLQETFGSRPVLHLGNVTINGLKFSLAVSKNIAELLGWNCIGGKILLCFVTSPDNVTHFWNVCPYQQSEIPEAVTGITLGTLGTGCLGDKLMILLIEAFHWNIGNWGHRGVRGVQTELQSYPSVSLAGSFLTIIQWEVRNHGRGGDGERQEVRMVCLDDHLNLHF